MLTIAIAIVLLPFMLKPDVGDMMSRSSKGSFSYKEYNFSAKGSISSLHQQEYMTSTDKDWKYIENRLFDGKSSQVPKLWEYITISLLGATKEDSLIIDGLMRELEDLTLNNKILYVDDFRQERHKNQILPEGGASFLQLKFLDHKDEMYSPLYAKSGNEVSAFYPPGYNHFPPKVSFKLTDSISFEKRKELITYFFWRSSCIVKFNLGERRDMEPEINSVFHTSEFKPENFTFTEDDKFLIQKLYSEDFLGQFKEYLNSRYSWWYAFQFLNYDLMMSITFTFFILILVMTMVFSIDVFSRKKFRFTYFDYLFPFLIVFFLTINLVFLYKILFIHSFVQDKVLLLFDVAGIILAVVASLILWLLEKYGLRKHMNFKIELILKMLFLFLSIQIPVIILISLVKEYFAYQFEYSLFTNIALLLTLGRGILVYLNHYSESLVKEKELELSRVKELNSQSQLQLLQAQINPHFLYNSLNSIAGLAPIDAVKTEKMALSLSDLFRYTINQKDKKTATVADEVEMVKNYLEIEKIRFGDRLDFEIVIDPALDKMEIPKFIIQPLIENAVKHGISKIEGQGEIVLSIYQEEKSIVIAVKDNGPSFPKGLVSGHGLQTIYDLLRITFGNKATIEWNNTPVKEIKIKIDNNDSDE